MANDSVPWAIGGGARMQAEALRALAYQATGGGQGVGAPGDCKVQALATPGNKVRVGPGTVVVRNTFAGVNAGQSYVAQVLSDIEVNVTATAGSPRSDLVVMRITDPQYDGSTPPSVQDGPYRIPTVIQNVASTTTSVDGLGLSYPAEALARLDIPASTATITNAMVKDVRRLARSRTSRVLKDLLAAPGQNHPYANQAVTKWPVEEVTVDVPSWAQYVYMTVTMPDLVVFNNLWGQWRFIMTDNTNYGTSLWHIYDYNNNAAYGWDAQSEHWIHSAHLWVAPMAGKTVRVYFEAQNFASATPPHGSIEFRHPYGSTIIVDCHFYETVV